MWRTPCGRGRLGNTGRNSCTTYQIEYLWDAFRVRPIRQLLLPPCIQWGKLGVTRGHTGENIAVTKVLFCDPANIRNTVHLLTKKCFVIIHIEARDRIPVHSQLFFFLENSARRLSNYKFTCGFQVHGNGILMRNFFYNFRCFWRFKCVFQCLRSFLIYSRWQNQELFCV